VGCQAVGCDDLGAPLTDPVARAVPIAVQRVQEIIASLTAGELCHAGT
jgi:Ni,Fe-hydrogenase maturation factor